MGRYKKSGKEVDKSSNSKQQENFRKRNQLTSKDMPNYDKATIDDKKFIKYSLNIESDSRGKDKAIVYKGALGYDKTNYRSLVKQIKSKANSGKAKMLWIEETIHEKNINSKSR